jgi:hypothetical protein
MTPYFRYLLTPILVMSGLSTSAIAQQASDIYVAKLNFWHKQPITDLVQVTDTKRYSNQPYFFDSQHLYFTQAEPINREGDDLQMDIFVYQLNDESIKNLTNSAESEYSATPVPNTSGMSVIRVNEQNKQELWKIDAKGKASEHLVPAIEPVGYQVWVNAHQLLLFVLGEPHTLQLVDTKTPNALGKVIDSNIGASLYQFEQSDWFLYSKMDESKMDGKNMLKAYHAKDGVTENIVELPERSSYFSVSATGHVVTSDGDTLYHRQIIKKGKSLQAQGAWTPIKIDSKACQNGISRTAISHFGDKIALVCNRP